MTIKVAVAGASGRMGAMAVALINQSADLKLHAALNSSTSLDQMVGADVLLDLTVPSVSPQIVDFAIKQGLKVVVGTSGWNQNRVAQLGHQVSDLANGSAVLIVPNFSIGSMLAQQFAATAARFFNSIEIVESHHSGKVDSPSGTAVRTAELISSARAGMTQPLIPGVEQPARGQVVDGVPIHSLRLAGVSAEQEIFLGGHDELLTISHKTLSIEAYSHGILLALAASPTLSGVSVGLDYLISPASGD